MWRVFSRRNDRGIAPSVRRTAQGRRLRRRLPSAAAGLAVIATVTTPVLLSVTATPAAADEHGASVSLAKSSSISSFAQAGTPVTYSYKVLNTGNQTLTSVAVTDPMTGLSSVSCPFTTLNPHSSETCTATYTTTQADVDAGSISNTGTVTATPTSGPTLTAKSSVNIPATQTPAVGIAKSASIASYSAAGTPVTYTYKVTNSGNVTLSKVTITDPMTGLSSINCGGGTNVIASLTPTASGSCTATYTTTAADVTAGSITNVGTATATTPKGSHVSSNGSLTIPATGQPFTCTSPTNFLSQGNPSTQLFYATTGSGSVTYNTLGSPYGSTYNALGYDTTDNFLYATVLGGNTLLKISSAGGVTSLGSISGYSSQGSQPADGAFDALGNYWITGGNGSTKAYEINVSSSPPSVIKTLTLSTAWQPIDWSLDDGYFWGLSGTTVYRVDLSTGTVSTFNAPSGVSSGNFGAAWTFSNGNLGFSNNANGDIYQISVANAAGTPTFALVSSYTGPVAGQSNDGAACVGETTDLGHHQDRPGHCDSQRRPHLDAHRHQLRAGEQLGLRRERQRAERLHERRHYDPGVHRERQ